MPDYKQSINDHYGQSDFCSKILKASLDAGKDVNSLLEALLDFHGWPLYSQRNSQQKGIACPHLTRCPCKKPC